MKKPSFFRILALAAALPLILLLVSCIQNDFPVPLMLPPTPPAAQGSPERSGDPVRLTPEPTATPAPANTNFSKHEFELLSAFLELTDENGFKNGEQLSGIYKKDDPTTWGDHIEWKKVDGLKYVSLSIFPTSPLWASWTFRALSTLRSSHAMQTI